MRIFNSLGVFSIFFICSNLFGQSIRVNPTSSSASTLSAEELTKEVLINGGVCSEISNFEYIENPDQPFPSTNRSWGYFEKGESSFPFESGIILTSGKALDAVGPDYGDIVSYGDMFGWDGDSDATELADYDSYNATYFEFDFIPFGNEISFNYIFASEEYPDYVCGFEYNDTFGFIISGPGITNDPGLSGKNIALLPNGNPVTIQNVNDQGCGDDTYYVPGADLNYFSDIQYGGRTIPLTASAEVIPGETYRIKLLIADAGDGSYDSAVFLEAGSFNLGGTMVDLEGAELGDNKTLCDVEEFPLTINLEAEIVTYQWYFNDVEIPGATSETYIATQTGNYKVEFITNNCNGDKDIDLVFGSTPILETPDLRFECSMDGEFVFNLEEFQPEINADFANLTFEYYTTLAGAQTQDPATRILNIQNFLVESNDGTVTVYVRVNNADTCFDVTTISMKVGIGPETESQPYAICDDNGDGFQVFNLTDFAPNLVLSNPAGLSYEFYTDANATQIIPNPTSYQNTSNPQTIYVKIVDPSLGEEACEVLEEFTIEVLEFPELESKTIELCDNENDQSEFIDLTQIDVVITDGIQVSYQYFNGIGGPAIANPANFEVTNFPTTIQVLIKNQAGTCEEFTTITIQALEVPNATDDVIVLEECSLTDFASFNLQDANSEFVADVTGLTFSYHLNIQDARNDENALPNTYTNTSANQIIFVRVENENGCFDIGQLQLTTVMVHNQLESPTSLCDDPYEINDGIAEFDLTIRHNDIEISLGATGYTIQYFESLADAVSGQNPIQNPTNYQNISSPQTIYARAETTSGACGGIVDFEIEVLEVPEFEIDETVYFCNTDLEKLYDAFGNFQSYKWTDSDGNIISTTSIVEFTTEGTYTLEVTETGLSCPAKRDIQVVMDHQPTITNIQVEGHTVTISATGGYAPYQYSYNNGLTWHDHYILENVPGGIHDLIVKSKYGCISEAKTFGVLGIPNFISPNGDGINDYWEIRGLEAHPDAHIQIFDRYGKLFVDRKIDANFRWDAKYLGNSIPSGDYWYIITITDGKKVSGHISVRNQ